MSDEEKLSRLYRDMFAAMVAKDGAELDRIHDDSFELLHMTGLRQAKKSYIGAILDGTLNYYSAVTDDLAIHISGDTAAMTGRSTVSAAVFGGSRRTWRLRLVFQAKRWGGGWRLTAAEASTW